MLSSSAILNSPNIPARLASNQAPTEQSELLFPGSTNEC